MFHRPLLAALALLVSIAAPARVGPADALFAGKPQAFVRKADTKGEAKVVGAYVPNWEPSSLLDRIKPGSVTHLLYAFARICGPGQLEKDAEVCTGKAEFELASGPREAEFDAAFLRLKQRMPEVKVVASVGGWGGSDPFFHIANDPARRAVFAASVVRFLREHPGFDGVDIDWEHPGDNGAANGVKLGSPDDGQGYADLMDDLRAAIDGLGRENGRRYLVTTAVNPSKAIVGRINFRQAARALDLVFMMTYDFYGPWTKTIGNHTALLPSAPGADDSLDSAVHNFTAAGVPASKLVAGVAMYSRGFSGVGKPVTGVPRKADFPAGGDGSIVYRELAPQAIGPRGQGAGGYRVHFDRVTQSYSLWNPATQVFIGYDDPRAVLAKGRYVLKHGLAGIFAWELSQDNGDLLNAMNLGVGEVPQR